MSQVTPQKQSVAYVGDHLRSPATELRRNIIKRAGLGCVAISLALGGCAGIVPPSTPKSWLDRNGYMVGAEELAPLSTFTSSQAPVAPPASAGTAGDAATKDLVGRIVIDSRTKCGQFLNELTLAQTSSDAGLDLASAVFSALGTAFTPTSTIHAMTAATSIIGGWKTALDSDVYAKATIANYSQAIQSTYSTHMKSYADALSGMTTDVIPSLEYGKIQSIHAECTLASAQASIAATLQANGPAAATTETTDTSSSSPVMTPPAAAAGVHGRMAPQSSQLTGSLGLPGQPARTTSSVASGQSIR